MTHRRDINDSEVLGFVQQAPQKMGEVEVPQIVDCVVDLKSIFGEGSLGYAHDAGIVYKEVYFACIFADLGYKISHTLQITQVQMMVLDHPSPNIVDLGCRLLGPVDVPGSEDDPAALGSQCSDHAPANSCISACDDGYFAPQVWS